MKRSAHRCGVDKLAVLVLLAFVLTAGCESTGSSQSEYDRVSQEIEDSLAQARAQAQAGGGTGQNIRITVKMLTVSVRDYSAVDALWQYVGQNVAIAKRPDVFARSGMKIGVASGPFSAQLNIVKQKLKSSEEAELFIVVADGSSGFINVGTEIAIPRFFYMGRWYSGTAYEFRQAGRSLRVTANRLPSDMIKMELTPMFSKFLSSGGNIELTELATTVMARVGQTVVLGGSTNAGENVATALFSRQTGSERKQTLITVTPSLQ